MAKSPPPKGGVKGGARFPRHSLEPCATWAQKLVSKTHHSPQPQDIILAGVVETKGPNGEVKVSAMKQFGLVAGDAQAYSASDLAKSIVNSPDDERGAFLKQAVLTPAIFKAVFDTFQGDEVSLAKIKQRFTDLNVHPDNASKCVQIFAASMTFSKLGSLNGEQIKLATATEVMAAIDTEVQPGPAEESQVKPREAGNNADDVIPPASLERQRGNAVIHVNVTVDSSLDTDKLERQLQLLRQYGAL